MSTLRGVVAALSLAVTMTGCATLPTQQSYNHAANIHVKRIEVLPTHPTRTSVVMLNHPGLSFGLIGGLVAVADQASKQKRLDAIATANDFEPLAYFKEQLTTQLNAKGYEVIWPDQQVQSTKVDRGPLGLRKAYRTASEGADALMDVNFGFVGYAASGAGSSSPYRPTVTLAVRLVDADGKQNLLTEYFASNNVFNMKKAITLDAAPQYAYPGFDDLEKAGPETVEGLKHSIAQIAAQVAAQL